MGLEILGARVELNSGFILHEHVDHSPHMSTSVIKPSFPLMFYLADLSFQAHYFQLASY